LVYEENFEKDLIFEEILFYHYKDFRENYELKKAKGESVIMHVVKNENSKIVNIFLQINIKNLKLKAGPKFFR